MSLSMCLALFGSSVTSSPWSLLPPEMNGAESGWGDWYMYLKVRGFTECGHDSHVNVDCLLISLACNLCALASYSWLRQ